MKKKKRKAGTKSEKPLHIVAYMRVGSVEQLSPKARQEYFKAKTESVRKGGK
jgi:hypothetical protein